LFAASILLSGRDSAGIWRLAFQLWCDDGTQIQKGAHFAIPLGTGALTMSVNNVTTGPDASFNVTGVMSPVEGDPLQIQSTLLTLGRIISVEAPIRA